MYLLEEGAPDSVGVVFPRFFGVFGVWGFASFCFRVFVALQGVLSCGLGLFVGVGVIPMGLCVVRVYV